MLCAVSVFFKHRTFRLAKHSTILIIIRGRLSLLLPSRSCSGILFIFLVGLICFLRMLVLVRLRLMLFKPNKKLRRFVEDPIGGLATLVAVPTSCIVS